VTLRMVHAALMITPPLLWAAIYWFTMATAAWVRS
jgi:hypothetical protein